MENETKNKKLRTNLSENNDNNRIIVLPLIIQKQILYLLYEQVKTDDIIKDYKIINYFFVNWNWFKYSQILFNHFIPHVYFDNNINIIPYDLGKYYNNNNKNNSNNDNKFKFVYNDLIKTIVIDYFDINNKSIDYINSLKSLETVIIGCLYYYLYGYPFKNSIWILTYLNKLNNKDLIINFELNPRCLKPNEPTGLEHIKKEEFKFKTNLFQVEYNDKTYGYVYEMIKELNPKYLKMKSDSNNNPSSSHLQQYHSISKLNQNYESVEIINDFIPLYALYRFLQSPNLHTLKFGLQFHFLSSIYDKQIINENYSNNNKSGNKDKTELDFNEMDNFEFIDFGNNFQDDIINDIKFYIDNGINEDSQIYCSFNHQWKSCLEMPPYSMSLWNQCLKLLSTNSTITNLSITHNCGLYSGCGYGIKKNRLYNENFINDFMNSLANNKTIKTLTLDFNSIELHLLNINLITKSIASMLDQNSTLESIYIYMPISKFKKILTKNTKLSNFISVIFL
ncbi:hypothetical protein ACTFIZ_005920 [Dictyostelium cf. discoideum]